VLSIPWIRWPNCQEEERRLEGLALGRERNQWCEDR